MALTIAHPFVSTVPEGSHSGTPGALVGPTEWNASHSVSGTVDASVGARSQLAADAAYYVNSSTGSNSNDGLTGGTAFATLQYAQDHLSNALDGQ